MISHNTLLAIFQQSEYDLKQLQVWYDKHQDDEIALEPEKWTPKLKMISQIVKSLPFLPLMTRYQIALKTVSPAEQFIRQSTYSKAKQKLEKYKKEGLIVVALAGSYGKTSTKNILEHAFSAQYKTLVTPKSVNTLLGISQIILDDLQPDHKLFIVEFGEYHPEDIPQLTQFIEPDYGILTPIGRQHLAIIGGFANIVNTFKYFINFFTDANDLLIADQNVAHYPKLSANTYGKKNINSYQISNPKVTRAGTEFEISTPNEKNLKAFTPLFGVHQAENMLTAIWLGEKLGMETSQIVKRFASQPYVSRRHEPTFAENNVLILDNSYNTNPDSVVASLELLKEIDGSNKIIITLGFVELDDEGERIHLQFGEQLFTYADYVGLIESPWRDKISKGFKSAGGKSSHIEIGKTQEDVLAKLRDKIIPNSVVLFEGGYQEVHI